MKKLMMTLAAALFATAVVAEVTSANVVGYKTITIATNQEWQILGCGLKDVGTGTNTIKIQDFITAPLAAGFTGANLAANADQLWVWLNGNYQKFFLWNHAVINSSNNGKWINSGNMTAWGGGASGAVSTYPIPAGAALWLKRKTFASERSFTTAGEVVSDASINQTLAVGFNFIGSCFSADWALNDAVYPINWLAAGATGANLAANADQLWVWLDGNYQKFFLWKHAVINSSNNGKWINSGNMTAWGGGASGAVSTYKVPFGAATWYAAKAGFTFAQPRPFSL